MDRHTTKPHQMTAKGSASLKATLGRGTYVSAVWGVENKSSLKPNLTELVPMASFACSYLVFKYYYEKD